MCKKATLAPSIHSTMSGVQSVENIGTKWGEQREYQLGPAIRNLKEPSDVSKSYSLLRAVSPALILNGRDLTTATNHSRFAFNYNGWGSSKWISRRGALDQRSPSHQSLTAISALLRCMHDASSMLDARFRYPRQINRVFNNATQCVVKIGDVVVLDWPSGDGKTTEEAVCEISNFIEFDLKCGQSYLVFQPRWYRDPSNGRRQNKLRESRIVKRDDDNMPVEVS